MTSWWSPSACTHHRFQPGAESGRQAGQQLPAFPRLGVEERVRQPLPRQHQQLRGKDLFVLNLQDGLRRGTRTTRVRAGSDLWPCVQLTLEQHGKYYILYSGLLYGRA